ncbi:MAG: ribonuclease III [Nitrospirae bacterium]|nr:ribonuclease III [Nitrospirota bacterium]
MARAYLDEAQQAIGYAFRQPRLLDEALTHKSHVNEIKDKGRKHNERLEFLGDAVLALVVSEHLAASFPSSTEGQLSKLKARLVSEASLAKAARRLNLGSLLRLGRGEELTQGREKDSLLANALEAMIAAIYLDGGLDPARAFILRAFARSLEDPHALHDDAVSQDYKTQLQEWCQKRFDTLPQYVTVRESGPDHQKMFEVQLRVQGDILGVGVGRTKKEAEQMAAKHALKQAISS